MQIKKKIEGDKILFFLNGKFTFADNQAFRGVIECLKNKDANTVIIDLTDVDFLDSAALGMLLVAREEASKSGAELILENAVGHVKKMFELSDFNSMFNIR